MRAIVSLSHLKMCLLFLTTLQNQYFPSDILLETPSTHYYEKFFRRCFLIKSNAQGGHYDTR